MRRKKIVAGLVVVTLAMVAASFSATAAPKPVLGKINVKVKPSQATKLYDSKTAQNKIPSLKPDPQYPPPQMEAQSAAGCVSNGSVCIYVHGEDLHVDYVYGFLWPFDGAPSPACIRGQLFINGSLAALTNEVCLNKGDSAVSYFWLNRSYPDPSLICVGFTGPWTGRPCETVHD